MGCCVTKSTYESYIQQAASLKQKADDLEDELALRCSLVNLENIDMQDTLDYLEYQEKLRQSKFTETLRRIIKVSNSNSQPADNPLLTPSTQLETPAAQAEMHYQIVQKFTETALKLENLHRTKMQEFSKRLEVLCKFIKEKTKTTDSKTTELSEKFKAISSYSSLQELTEGLLSLSELQKELELLQRKYNYKNFIFMQEEKNKERDKMREKIEELKHHIQGLNNNWADMKDEQRRKAEQMQFYQDSISNNKEKLARLAKEKIELEENLLKFGTKIQGVDEAQAELESRKKVLENIQRDIDELASFLNESEHDSAEMEILREKKLFLTNEVDDLGLQLKKLEEIQRNESEKKDEELQSRKVLISKLQDEIKEKQYQLGVVDEMYVNDLKNQVSMSIVQRFKFIPQEFLRIWRENSLKIAGSSINESMDFRKSVPLTVSKVKNDAIWDRNKFATFLNKLFSAKYKKDESAIKENKLPLSIHEYLEVYLKGVSGFTWENDFKEIINTLESDSQDPIYSAVKSMFGLSKEVFSYCFNLFLTEASFVFDSSKSQTTETVLFEKILPFLEQFSENNRDLLGSLIPRLRPKDISEEEFAACVIKIKLKKTEKKISEICTGIDSFFEDMKIKLDVMLDDFLLQAFKEKCEKSGTDFTAEAENLVNSADLSKLIIEKKLYIAVLIDAYKEHKIKETKNLENILGCYDVITEETFRKLVFEIFPDVNPELIPKLFREASMENTDSSIIKPFNFTLIVFKFGIGGYGIGPFNVKKLQQISLNLLNALVRPKTQEEEKKEPVKSQNLKPIKALDLLRVGLPHPESQSVRTGTKIARFSDMSKSKSPQSLSDKSILKNYRGGSPYMKD